MTPKKLASINRLPQLESIWYIGSRIQRIWIAPEGEEPHRPHLLVTVDMESGFLLSHDLLIHQPTAKDIEKLLYTTMKKPPELTGLKPHRPSQVFFEDKKVMTEVSPNLKEVGIRARYRPQVDLLNQLSNSLEEYMRGDRPPIPRLLAQPGINPKLAGDFFVAAAEFFRAAPWVQLSNNDVLAVSVLPQNEPYYIIIMGQGGVEYGMLIHKTWKDLLRKFEPVERVEDLIPPGGTHSVTYEDITGVPFDDLDDIQRHRWEIAGSDAYPVAIIIELDMLKRPTRGELLWYEAAMRAIPVFLRDHANYDNTGQILPSQAVIPVKTSGGQVKVEIKIPAGELPKYGQWTNKPDIFGSEEILEPVPDRRAMEGDLARITREIGGIPSVDENLQEAQNVMYEAWEEQNPAKRIALAYKALRISENCADAYVLLAEEEAGTPEQALKLYQQGVEAGRRALGEEFIKENKGHFWGLLETRPYMRALQGVARCEWILGRNEEAIKKYNEMLRLNPNDNQGVRYVLVDLYLQLNKTKELEKLLKKYKGEYSSVWKYTEALLAFRSSGPDPRSNQVLAEALSQNPYVPAFLTGQKRIPNLMPEYISPGTDTEAIDYAANHLNFWRQTPGAVEWLSTKTPKKPPKPEEPPIEQEHKSAMDLILEYADILLEDIETPLVALPLRKDFIVFLEYLRDQKVTGTQSTGNLPLKAVREITARFVDSPQLETSIDGYPRQVRSASEFWPIYFPFILGLLGTLIKGGPSRRLKLTDLGHRFLEAPAHTQVFYLLVIWWQAVEWSMAYHSLYKFFDLPENFRDKTLASLLKLPVGRYVDFESYADSLIKSTKFTIALKDQEFSHTILHTAIQRMVIETLVKFGILEATYRTDAVLSYEFQEPDTFRVTKLGRRLLETIKIA